MDGAYMICEMFSYYATKGIGLLDKLDELYKTYGYCLNTLHSYEFDGSAGFAKIRQAIIEFRPRLVVIDPIQAYLGSDSDLQIAGRARKLMRRLGMWAAGYDCAIVLIGHLNKKEG